MVYILLTLWVIAFSLFIRNQLVWGFRIKLTKLCYARELEHTDKYDFEYTLDLNNKYSYTRMLFSFKPLKLKYWFTEEEIKELTTPYC